MNIISKLSFISLLAVLVLFSCDRQIKDPKFGEEVVIQSYEDSLKMITVRYLEGDTSNVIKTYYYRNGQVYMKGQMIKNLREGEWKAYNEQGNLLTTGNYKNGIDHGLKTVYFENGNKRYEGQFENGEKIGKWQFYTRDGTLVKELNFEPEKVKE